MAGKSIRFVIDKAGNPTITDACGFGDKCHDVTARIEKKLGKVDESSRENTANYNKPVEEKLTH